jgi:hypothetical protein
MIIISTLKHVAIGVLAGSVDHLLSRSIGEVCSISDSILCLKPGRFFDPENLRTFSLAFHNVTTAIQLHVQSYMPSIPITANNCHELLKWDHKLSKDLVDICCSTRIRDVFNVQTFLSGAITEEFTDRYLLQTIALPFIAKLIPERIGKPLLSPSARVLITAIFFAVTHYRIDQTDVTSQFVGGIVYGILFEKFGFVAATAAHFTSNIFFPLSHKKFCQTQITELTNNLKILKALG